MADQEPEAVQVSRPASGITVITINRKQRKNAVDLRTGQKLYAAFRAFEDDTAQKVCVLHGAHSTFCAGGDLHSIASMGKDWTFTSIPRVNGRNIGPMGPSRLQVQKPVIAAVSGHAVAGGLELSLIADMRVVEEDAIFGVFCRRWGVPLIDGGTVRLQAVVGLGRAMDMILTGRPVDAKEALSMGLANRVVPRGKALEEALKIAKQLLEYPAACMLADRSSCYYSAYNATSFEDALCNEFDEGAKVLDSESARGAAKFSAGAGRHGSFENL
jgi:enoyl-CoA hydratase/carnithine racemase